MASILYPTLVLGGLGAVLSLILLVAARRFAVYEDPLVKAIEDALPNANCGACGEAGCHAFAEALVKNRERAVFCPPGGSETAEKIARILGTEANTQEVPLAIVMCDGSCDKATNLGHYAGIESCRAAALIDGGDKVCPYGCLGLGSCEVACDYGAIRMQDGLAVVDEAKCVGCGACVKACPRGIIRMGPRSVRVFVACVSHASGKEVRGYCEVGCIGCKICVKACDDDAIQFDDSLARVDHDKCTACGNCVAACPRWIIFGVHLSDDATANVARIREEAAAKDRARKEAAARKGAVKAPEKSDEAVGGKS